MATISKNVKRLRTAKKLTQEQLAESLNVTRQTISSWENDRTQPDIDMLAALAKALDTDIEDLIYGKRKHVGLEADPGEKRRTMSLVLLIIGSILLATGVVFLFVYFWNELPSFMKTVLSFLPLLVGGGAGLFTVLKKKESVPFREVSAVLWFAGVMATNALINALFSVDFGFENLLLADVLLLLPVPFLLDSVFAYTAETALCVVLLFQDFAENVTVLFSVLGFVALAVTLSYVFLNKQIKPVKQYCAWLGLLAGCAAVTFHTARLVDTLQDFLVAPGNVNPPDVAMLGVAMPMVFFIALFIASRGRRFDLQFTFPAGAVLTAALPVFTAISLADGKYMPDPPFTWIGYLALALWTAVCLVPAIFAGRGTAKGNKVKSAFNVLFLLYLAEYLIFGWTVGFVTLLFSLAAGVLTVVAGVKRGRLLIANFGMLQLAANLLIILYDIKVRDFLWIGATFVVLGVIILITNKVMIKKFEARKAAAAAAQAQADAVGSETLPETGDLGNA